MNTLTQTESVEMCAARYRRDHGIDATINEHSRITIRAGNVCAICMPQQLGKHVYAELDCRDLVAPIIATHASENWTFLTESARPEDRPRSPYDPLFPLRAKRMLPGSVITLPSPWPYDVLRSWVVAPEGKQRPPLELVAEITTVAAMALPKV